MQRDEHREDDREARRMHLGARLAQVRRREGRAGALTLKKDLERDIRQNSPVSAFADQTAVHSCPALAPHLVRRCMGGEGWSSAGRFMCVESVGWGVAEMRSRRESRGLKKIKHV